MTNPLEEYLASFISERRLGLLDKVLDQRTRHLTVVLEDFHKPHNANACLRSCDCFGIQDAHIIETDSEFKKSQGVAAGAAGWMTLQQYKEPGTAHQDCFENLRSRGYRLLVADLVPEAVPLDELDISQPTAILFGSERRGVSEVSREAACGSIRIPMYGFTESLNVSVACALVLSNLSTRLFHSDIAWQLSDSEKQDLWRLWLRKAVGYTWPEIEQEFFKRHPQYESQAAAWRLSPVRRRKSERLDK
ncbi:tRNA (guanosine(18)-2'-O)-methyltransferase [Polystyrenella longa]|uniref:tRNA (guanosine(18)-2'-O)-methyltransferase n=1 Tax=Polystyrenella longa TaxID=2528007 RepID=A0A518CKD3_9PLAN|nr:RNA methyltransferase [Polystyrenella longa]QDU79682.1 tRNA (guanosine(18)-2'-O)-methyltransferase [Polystyrenella longa]